MCSLFSNVSYTGSQLVDLDSGICVCVLCSHNMSVTLAGSQLVDLDSGRCVCIVHSHSLLPLAFSVVLF